MNMHNAIIHKVRDSTSSESISSAVSKFNPTVFLFSAERPDALNDVFKNC